MMIWYSPKTWSKGLKILVSVMVVFLLFVFLFGSQADNLKGSNEEGSSSAKSRMNMAPKSAPMDTADSSGYEESRDGGMGVNDSKSDADVLLSGELEEKPEGNGPADRKIIKDGSSRIETKEFDLSLNKLDQIITQSGGFSENRNIRGNSINRSDLRYASIVFRVPAEKFEAIMQNMSDVGTVVESNTNGTDITDQYIDMEARLKNLKIQEQTLLELMGKAEKLDDVITLEARISEVRYEIERIENQLKNYDRLVQYSRISVDLVEVVEVTEKKPIPRTLGDKVKDAFNDAIEGFKNGVEEFTLLIVGNWILFIFILLIIITIGFSVRISKKRRKKTEKLPENKEKSE